MRNLPQLAAVVQRNCDISDARYAGDYGLCTFLLKMREYYRWENELPFARDLKEDAYDLAFCDPPYESRMLDRVIDHWKENRFSKILVCEHAKGHDLPRGKVQRTFDDTVITVYRR